MWKISALLLIFSFLLLPLFLDTAFAEPKFSNYAPDRLLIKFKKDLNGFQQAELLETNEASVLAEIKQLDIHVIKVPEHALERIFDALSKNERIEYVEKDYQIEPALIPNDPNFSNQWYHPAINSPAAWDVTQGNELVPIAILDSGVDPNHPDISNKLVNGFNFYDNNDDWSDVCGHGTRVAGVAAAITNNDIGISGVSWNSPIIPIRITDANCFGYYSTMIQGIVYAADNGARVANISYQIFDGKALSSAAQYMNDHGGWVVAAAGNTGDFEDFPDNPYIISVGATSSNNGITSFSSYGPYVDFVAPGSDIYTIRNGGLYGYSSGTSFSSPIVAGAIALMISNTPSMNASEVLNALIESSVDRGDPGRDNFYGWGLIDVNAALGDNESLPIDITPPQVTITSPLTDVQVAGSFTVSVDSSDDVQLVNVALYIDDEFFDQKSNAPFDFVIDSSTWAEGEYEIKAIATDSGENSNFDTIVVNVIREYNDKTPPEVSITSPQNDAKVGDSFIVSIDSFDEISEVNVALFINDLFYAQKSIPPFIFQIDSSEWIEGTHQIKAIATDANMNSNSDTIFVQLVREVVDDIPPSIKITSPTDGSSHEEEVSVNVVADDNEELNHVEFYVNDEFYEKSFSAPFNFILNSDDFEEGWYVLKAVAYDSSNNSNEDSISIQLLEPPPPSIIITHPLDGDELKGRVVGIFAKTSEFSVNPSVKFFIDDILVHTDSEPRYKYNWHLKEELLGLHTITVKASNSEDESASHSITVNLSEKPKQRDNRQNNENNKENNLDKKEINKNNVAPEIKQISDKFMFEGKSKTIKIITHDKNNDDLEYSITSPGFVKLVKAKGMHLEINPGFEDAGTYTISITVSEIYGNQPLSTTESFELAVIDGKS